MSQRIEEFKQTVNTSLNDSTKPWKAAFDFLEEKSGVPRLYLFSGKCNGEYWRCWVSTLLTQTIEEPLSSELLLKFTSYFGIFHFAV